MVFFINRRQRYAWKTFAYQILDAYATTGRFDGTPSAVDSTLEQRESTEHFAVGTDGMLYYHYFHAGRWRVDFNTFAQGGKVKGSIAAIYSPKEQHAAVFFRGEDGYLRYFHVQGGRWRMRSSTHLNGHSRCSLSSV